MELARDIWNRLQEREQSAIQKIDPTFVELKLTWGRRFYYAELASNAGVAARAAAGERYRERMQQTFHRLTERIPERSEPAVELPQARYGLLEAQLATALLGESAPRSRPSGPTTRAAPSLRTELARVAHEVFDGLLERTRRGREPVTPELVELMCRWSRRIREAESVLGDRAAAAQAHRDQMNGLLRELEAMAGQTTPVELNEVRYELLESTDPPAGK